jgi:predicted nucleotidyltransferase
MANPNLEILQTAVAQLGDLADELVFVGGCTTGLLITDEATPDIRPTKDVDGIVEALTYSEFIKFEERLRNEGFVHAGDPICRWAKGDILLDVMPTNGEFLGFKNTWFAEAVETSKPHKLSSGKFIRVVSPPYFVATKLEAFLDRGENDFLASHDLEDLITVINGREELKDEIQNAPENVRKYISGYLNNLLANQGFIDALPGHLMPDAGRVGILMGRLREMSNL